MCTYSFEVVDDFYDKGSTENSLFVDGIYPTPFPLLDWSHLVALGVMQCHCLDRYDA